MRQLQSALREVERQLRRRLQKPVLQALGGLVGSGQLPNVRWGGVERQCATGIAAAFLPPVGELAGLGNRMACLGVPCESMDHLSQLERSHSD